MYIEWEMYAMNMQQTIFVNDGKGSPGIMAVKFDRTGTQ